MNPGPAVSDFAMMPSSSWMFASMISAIFRGGLPSAFARVSARVCKVAVALVLRGLEGYERLRFELEFAFLFCPFQGFEQDLR